MSPERKRQFGLASFVIASIVAAVFLSQKVYSNNPPDTHGPHLTEEGNYKYTNHLIHAESPYLLQHAHNPVNWYQWGEEAFEKARRENKPIFLSIGYSTCHWCHVMRRESFSDPETAEVLNEHFVSIKVDREERPDVDQVYMTFVQATTGSGGWPLNVWLTPELKPFFGGTYFPPEDRYGRRSFKSMLLAVAESWEGNQEEILSSSERIVQQLQSFQNVAASKETELKEDLLQQGYEQIEQTYDGRHGGFGSAPKFPRPVSLGFMFRYYHRTGNKKALEMTLHTLQEMAQGGIHDHIGGGFHRYAVDDRWHVPHFEKMLYNQAQLAGIYLEAYQITGEEFYADVTRDILEYVRRDMTGRKGQFFSAEDADSPLPENPNAHAEGAFYVWEAEELEEMLPEDQANVFKYYYGVKPEGNVQEDPHGEFENKNVLIVSYSIEETAKKFDIEPHEVRSLLNQARSTLFKERAERPRPFLDDKTLTAWNGLMISAFSRAYQVLGEERYLESAFNAAEFIRAQLYQSETGILLRRHRQGDSSIEGFADDYAYLIQGLLDLYEAGFDVSNLQWARKLQEKQDELFWDSNGKGYYQTTGEDESILLRMKEAYDGAEPSPNSVAALNLLRLGEMFDSEAFRSKARATMSAFAKQLNQSPSAMPHMLSAFSFQLAKPKQIVIAGEQDAEDTQSMLRALHKEFVPFKILLLADGAEGQETLSNHLEFIRGIEPIQDRATVYVCKNYVCDLPTTKIATMLNLVRGGQADE